MTKGSGRSLPWLFAVPLLMWVAAGAVNSTAFIMGNPSTGFGVATTLAAVCAWPVAGWFAGAGESRGFVRFAAVFWTAEVVGAPLAFWALNASSGMSASQGGFLLPLLLFALMAPLYGLYALLPAWEPIAQAATVGITASAMTLVAYVSGRRIYGARRTEDRNDLAT